MLRTPIKAIQEVLKTPFMKLSEHNSEIFSALVELIWILHIFSFHILLNVQICS